MIAVILSYNHPEITQRCLDACLRLIEPQKILLVHNGSLPKHQQLLQKNNSTIHHLVLAKNLGFSGGANAGLAWAFARAEWALFITNDTQLLQFEVPKQSGFYAPLIYARKLGKVDSIGGHVDLLHSHLSHNHTTEKAIQSIALKNFYVPGTAFWLDRQSYQMGGRFAECLHTYWEDVELSLRYSAKKIVLGINTKTEFLHSIGKTCHKDSHYTTYLYQRNRRVVSRHYSRQKIRTELNYWSEMLAKFFKLLLGGQGTRAKQLALAFWDSRMINLENSFSTKPPINRDAYEKNPEFFRA